MSDLERRGSTRRAESFHGSVVTEATQIDGGTVNISPRGVLLRASRRIVVRLQLGGKEYRASLVRAHPLDDGSILYAVKLDEPSIHFAPDPEDEEEEANTTG